MDKRKEENLRVKKNITDTLFTLMEKKSLAEIRITELVEKAGVARASFYRNYSSKEDVLVTLIRDILDEFREEMDLSQGTVYTYQNVLLSFQYFKKYRNYVLDLQRSGFSAVLMDELNHFHESVEGHMPYDSIEKYILYMYIGALMNTAVTWLTDDERNAPEDMARYFLKVALRMHDRGNPA
ncbi:MAG: TetR/AcrR family transcriptional regulator [Clostridium sp.]|nr:TetR/AcrR family transcriptional regulator [Bacteroides sp.]MCM1564070.1 TetR/AcrR family transcriptional regulator [Clostridium sp.]